MRAGRAWAMSVAVAAVVSACVAAVWLGGCRDEVKDMSRYPYFLETLDGRWPVVLASFQSAEPNLDFVPVILKDMEGAAEAMDWSYNEANREEALAKLKSVAKNFRADLSDKLDIRFEKAKLIGDATVKDVAGAVERCHKEYLEFKPMVAME